MSAEDISESLSDPMLMGVLSDVMFGYFQFCVTPRKEQRDCAQGSKISTRRDTITGHWEALASV